MVIKTYPYSFTSESGKEFRVVGTHCWKVNDIHHDIRVIHLCDQVGLNFDIISLVLNAYRERLTGLPKPLTTVLVKDITSGGSLTRRYPVSLGLSGSYSGRWDSLDRARDMVWTTSHRRCPWGFRGVVEENWSLIERLEKTRFFKYDNYKLCRPDRVGRVKPINYTLLDKEL